MARPLRIEFEGAVYHVTARGNEKRAIFEDDKDFSKFRNLLKKYAERFNVRLHCYALMTNHYHLLLETPGANLTAFMHNVQSHYTGYFNRRHDRAGHLFQGRYKAHIVDKESYLLEVSRYIHLNPVRAGLAPAPGEWRWSSYDAYARPGRPDAEFLFRDEILRLFGASPEAAMKEYRAFVAEKIGKEPDSPFDNIAAQLIIGSADFIKTVKEFIGGERETIGAEIVSGRELTRWTAAEAGEAVAAVAETFAVKEKEILEKGGYRNRARDTAVWVFHRYSRWRVTEIGGLFGVSGSAVCKTAGRIEKAAEKDRGLSKKIKQICSTFTA